MSKGFTLIELLISITIVGVILVIIMGGLRIGVKAWESGERNIEINQRQQIVLSLMKDQLASVDWTEIKREDEEPYYFGGKNDSMECISGVSIIPGNEFGKVYVTYRIVEGDGDLLTLQIAEQSMAKINKDTTLFEPGDDEYRDLITNAFDMWFEYLEPQDKGEAQWVDDFAPEKASGLPLAIRFNLKMDEQTPVISIVARIKAEQDENQ